MKTRKGQMHSQWLKLVMAIAVIIMFVLTWDLFYSKSTTDTFDCETLFRSINYGDLKQKVVTRPFIEQMQKNCPSRQVQVKDNDVSEAVDLVEECWRKVGGGNFEILHEIDGGEVLCLHCGSIISNDQVRFSELFVEEIYERESQSSLLNKEVYLNLNDDLLYKEEFMPQTLSEEEIIDVFFFVTRYRLCFESQEVEGFCQDEFLEGIPGRQWVEGLTQSSKLASSVLSKVVGDEKFNLVGGIFIGKLETKDSVINEGELTVDETQVTVRGVGDAAVGVSKIQCTTLVVPQQS